MMDKSWDWELLSMNSSITWYDVSENLDEPWDWSGLSGNPSVTWKIVQENLDKPWNWSALGGNNFDASTTSFAARKAKQVADMCHEYIMAYCWNPERPLGQYLITTAFDEIDRHDEEN